MIERGGSVVGFVEVAKTSDLIDEFIRVTMILNAAACMQDDKLEEVVGPAYVGYEKELRDEIDRRVPIPEGT